METLALKLTPRGKLIKAIYILVKTNVLHQFRTKNMHFNHFYEV